MKFKAYASASSGNFYVLESGRSRLAIEAGLPFRKIQECLGFQVSSLDGVLISHSHADHSRSAPDLVVSGVDVFASRQTLAHLDISCHRARALRGNRPSYITRADSERGPGHTWTVVPFDCIHDVPTLGFLIGAPDGDQLLFATDTAYVPIKTEGCTHFALECNYSRPILEASTAPSDATRRIVQNHMGIENVLGVLEAHETSKLREVHLLHLSDGHSDAMGFQRAVSAAAPAAKVFVAPRGI